MVGFRQGLEVRMIYLIKRGCGVKLNRFGYLFDLIEDKEFN